MKIFYYNTTQYKHEAIRHLHVRELEIHSPIDVLTDVDGQKGATFPLSVRCLENELRVQCHRTQHTNP